MEMENPENAGILIRTWHRVKAAVDKVMSKIIDVGSEAKKLGVEDPRRIVHSFKVGLAISLVSLFYYFDFLYEGFGVSAMWAVITVVVVLEFSVGGTLGRGVNRGIATLLGGALGVGAHRLASFAGERLEPVLLGLSVFLLASAATFMRFFPKLKARYDYGVLIFILTFCLITVSGSRDDEVIHMAHRRLSTVLIGGSSAVLICIFICPIWAGQDLHDLIAANIEELGIFLEGFGRVYFKTSAEKLHDNKVSMNGYKSVLNSKGLEESLANSAKWEPRHGKFRYRHPWEKYLKIGAITRECAYRIDALNSYLNSEMQLPADVRTKFQDVCEDVSSGCSRALMELSLSINKMTCSRCADAHVLHAKSAAKKLKTMLKSGLFKEANFLDALPAATVASLLIEIVCCTVEIANSVHELAVLANFKSFDESKPTQAQREKVKRIPSIEGSHNVTIAFE